MNWENEARRIVKAELVRRGVTYERLAGRLKAIGVQETERSIANKMSRGSFPFTFVLQCMRAIGADTLTIDLSLQRADESQSSLVIRRGSSHG